MNAWSFTVTATRESRSIATLMSLEGEVLYPDRAIYYAYLL